MDSGPRDNGKQRMDAVPVGDRPFAVMLRAGAVATMIALPVVVIVLWLVRDAKGGGSAALGALIAILFFAAGLAVMQRIAGDNPMTMMAGALAVYLGQIIFLGIIILVLGGVDWIDGVAFGLAVLVIALVWQVAQVLAFMRMRKPVYDSPAVDDEERS
ncbi:hypothetical protein PZ938_10020 [Luteipulveratus sp. YIM 133132]|uniref:ATP synthase protein I n=1 Tax=Luteipulveratus flavus TaxID=3031728 RepID=A0ABT6C867_9MICO|nr:MULTISPECIES: hypothetical protein [unclassified Luteipulveratus]MDE9365938.1 hypothetical protein [Luteipulveratus sp. YIM 133132]MDF8265128.1 hypothetical protein [Luteipulveratus sp. YIM 133296]